MCTTPYLQIIFWWSSRVGLKCVTVSRWVSNPPSHPPPPLSLQRKNWAVTDRKGNGPRIVRSQTFSFTHSYWGTWWKSSHFRILSYDHLVLFGIQYIPTDSLIDECVLMRMMREYLWWVSEEEIDVLSICRQPSRSQSPRVVMKHCREDADTFYNFQYLFPI